MSEETTQSVSAQNEKSPLTDLIETISSIPSISYLKNCVARGTIQQRGFNSNSRSISGNIYPSWIRMVKITKVTFKKFLDCYQENYRYHDSEANSPFLNVFNNQYHSRNGNEGVFNALTYMGCNIASDLKISGYHYNICDIFSSYMFDKSSLNNGRHSVGEYEQKIARFIYKMIFIGEKNYLVGFITTDAILYLDEVLLEKLRKSDYETYKDIIKKVLSVFGNANAIFFQLNTIDIDKMILDTVSKFIVTKFDPESKDCTVIPPDNIDIFSDNSVVDNLVAKVKTHIDTYMEKLLQGTRWGVKNQYSYKKLLEKILVSKDKDTKAKIDKAFANGLLYGDKLKLSGWVVSENQRDGECTWEKEVKIIPCRVNYKNTIYNIDPNWKDNPYHIDKLYVTASGIMYCEGVHPNVSSGNVCMGDIRGKITLSDVKMLTQNLNRCENLLTLINYDSAYDGSKRDEVLKHATKAGYSELTTDHEYIGENEKIIDVQFEDDLDEVIDETDDTTEFENASQEQGPAEVVVNEEPAGEAISESAGES